MPYSEIAGASFRSVFEKIVQVAMENPVILFSLVENYCILKGINQRLGLGVDSSFVNPTLGVTAAGKYRYSILNVLLS